MRLAARSAKALALIRRRVEVGRATPAIRTSEAPSCDGQTPTSRVRSLAVVTLPEFDGADATVWSKSSSVSPDRVLVRPCF